MRWGGKYLPLHLSWRTYKAPIHCLIMSSGEYPGLKGPPGFEGPGWVALGGAWKPRAGTLLILEAEGKNWVIRAWPRLGCRSGPRWGQVQKPQYVFQSEGPVHEYLLKCQDLLRFTVRPYFAVIFKVHFVACAGYICTLYSLSSCHMMFGMSLFVLLPFCSMYVVF